MIITLGALMTCLLFLLGSLHLYWATGGTWGFDKSLPTKASGQRVINPKRIDCIVVALGLWSFAFYFLIKVGFIPICLPRWMMDYGSWIIAGIFALRSIGDFKYVGFTKRIKGTDFARLDTQYYSPLCLLLTISGIIIGVAG